MTQDTPPLDSDVLAAVEAAGGVIEPDQLINTLAADHTISAVIESLQRAIERGKISLNGDGMVVPARVLVLAA